MINVGKKILPILVSIMMVIAMIPVISVEVNADEDGTSIISLKLDYDELSSFNTNCEGYEVTEELYDDLKVQSQAYHELLSVTLQYVDNNNAFRSYEGNLSKGSEYYIGMTIGFKEGYARPSSIDAVKLNGRTLSKCSSSVTRPGHGEFKQGQPTTVEGVPAYVIYIPVEAEPKWPAPTPYMDKESCVYTGSAIVNEVVNYNPGVQFVSKDSVLSATNVGTYTAIIKIKDKSAYCNEDTGKSEDVVLTWKIIPKGTSITSLSKGTKSFTAKWSKKTTQVTGYQLRYSTSSSMSGAKTVTVTSNKTTSKTVKNLKAKKKYYVQVRTYKTVSGKKIYSEWSAKKSVTTK